MKLSRILIFLGSMTLLAAWIYGVGEFLPNSNILESKDNGYAIAPSGAKEIIIAGGSCRKISSTSATQYFIPTRTTAESSSFFANPPSGVTIGACVSCTSTHPACEGISCSLTTGTPSSANQAWAQWATSCGFTCNSGYSGPDCDAIIPRTCNFTSALDATSTYHPTYSWICEPAIDGQEVWKFTANMIGIYYKIKCICQ